MNATTIQQVILHKVGNKNNEEGMFLSPMPLLLDENLNNLLLDYFLSSFKSEEHFNFYHENGCQNNEIYRIASEIFDNAHSLFEHSITLAQCLYNASTHPKIKGGEFYVVYFKNYLVNEQAVDAIGLFKAENQDVFLKTLFSADATSIQMEQGTNIHKMDKGCLILNIEKEQGYIISIVDNISKGVEAQYWIDDFLSLRQRQDEYYNTQNLLTLTKTFITKELPQQYEVSKADQADLLNKSVNFFKTNDNFNMEDFTNEVMQHPKIIDTFTQFKSNYQQEYDMDIADNFTISDNALKKQARVFKSVIKLDKNFHIYVHGNRELIEQGIDETGRKYYKIYYKEET
ncbi:MAG: nucleoid-associated protein [Bacteroidales bacterium]|jgi:hypothetical protein|nr:nucleoid-associated protein [Bacteroidales bacterium]